MLHSPILSGSFNIYLLATMYLPLRLSLIYPPSPLSLPPSSSRRPPTSSSSTTTTTTLLTLLQHLLHNLLFLNQESPHDAIFDARCAAGAAVGALDCFLAAGDLAVLAGAEGGDLWIVF